ncbi:hypothetical protein [Nocardia sp. NBC_01327]|uniref:hypothetical protein n=1 Tax=Nocardia sp. NBC_01327 TaxID=2903593 RepID=UPI002E1424CF|nr:hypothetical protein OG326_15840 [Nocardia sp. NBC_01327]
MPDYAVLGALNLAGRALSIACVATEVAAPESGPGLSLSHDSVRRILTRLQARGLVEEGQNRGWQPTQRGRVLWASKGKRFTL